jgi:hypothetical protein
MTPAEFEDFDPELVDDDRDDFSDPTDDDLEDEPEDEVDDIDNDNWLNRISEDMDGDHESALRDAGWGTDEDYGFFGGEDY